MIRILVGVLILGGSGSAWAQAWTRDAGQAYVEISGAYINGDRIYNPDFTRSRLATSYRQLNLSAYAEVGIIDRWLTASFNAELLRRNELVDMGRTQGLGEMRLGLFSGLVTSPLRVSAGVIVGLPTGDSDPASDGTGDPETDLIARSLPTGDGEFDLEPTVAVGYSFAPDGWPLGHYAQGLVGYTLRTSSELFGEEQSFADGISYRAEFGTNPRAEGWDRLWVILVLSGVESFASNRQAASGAVGLGNGVTYTSFGLRLRGRLYDTWSLNFGVDGAFRARSIVAAPVFRLGLSYES